MRLDRIASVHLAHPINRVWNRRRNTRIPILMYHSISDGTGEQHPYYETSTSPTVFEHHMRFLLQHGYSTIGLGEAVNSLQVQKPGPKSVVITFDDGYRDFYTAAYPVLCEYGMTATVFVVSGLAGDPRTRFKGKDCLIWSEVKELRSNGIDIGSHTVTHPELELMDLASIDNEVGRSKQTLEDKLGVPIKSFAYPYAFPEHNRAFSKSLAEILESHGYENGVSTVLGRARSCDNRFFLPRLPVNTCDDLRLFQAKLEGGYDWLHLPQSIYKKVRHHVLPGTAQQT